MELIRLDNIHKIYHLGEVEVPVLRGVLLSIHHGEMVALMGASGSGKTTLMNILGCLDHPTSGRYWLDGEEMSRLQPDQRAPSRGEDRLRLPELQSSRTDHGRPERHDAVGLLPSPLLGRRSQAAGGYPIESRRLGRPGLP